VLKARRTDNAAEKPASTWKPGDDPATRPYNATDYFTGMDRARNVIFHEVGHQIHQMMGKKGKRREVGIPPLEKRLRAMFHAKFYKLGEGHENKKLVSTTYATTNEHEWWAESFGLYMMGRVDLVDADLKALIEELLDEVMNDRA
jgi:Mlc titration factor MtfA (ptsG expression regulator)